MFILCEVGDKWTGPLQCDYTQWRNQVFNIVNAPNSPQATPQAPPQAAAEGSARCRRDSYEGLLRLPLSMTPILRVCLETARSSGGAEAPRP